MPLYMSDILFKRFVPTPAPLVISRIDCPVLPQYSQRCGQCPFAVKATKGLTPCHITMRIRRVCSWFTRSLWLFVLLLFFLEGSLEGWSCCQATLIVPLCWSRGKKVSNSLIRFAAVGATLAFSVRASTFLAPFVLDIILFIHQFQLLGDPLKASFERNAEFTPSQNKWIFC